MIRLICKILELRTGVSALLTGLLLGAAALPLCGAEPLEFRIKPDELNAGMTGELVLTSHDGTAPRIVKLPRIPNLEWKRGSSSSIRTMIVNGKSSSTHETGYQFMPMKEGVYRFPAMQIKSGKNSKKIDAFELTVGKTPSRAALSATDETPGKDTSAQQTSGTILAMLRIPAAQKTIYVGEEIPVTVSILQQSNVRIELRNYPKIETGEKMNVVFKDYSAANRDNAMFDVVEPLQEVIDGKLFYVYPFKTALRPLSAGEMQLSARVPIMLFPQSDRRSGFFDDPFFSSALTHANAVERVLQTKSETVQVKPLPPPPDDQSFTQLVGDWQIRILLDSEKEYRVGTPVTIRVKISGKGSLEALNMPKMPALQGFRSYPPEVEKNLKKKTAVVRYILIPTDEGNSVIRLNLSSFNPVTGRYQETKFEQTLKIEKAQDVFQGGSGKNVVDTASGGTPSAAVEISSGNEPQKNREGLLYLHKDVQKNLLTIPLRRNAYMMSFLMLAIGIVFYLGALLLKIRRDTLAGDPAIQRRISARARKSGLLKKLKESPAEEIADRAGNEICEYLNDLLNLPPGASLGETALEVKSRAPELSELLDKLARIVWMPSAKMELNPAFKSDLIRALAKFSAILLLVLTPFAGFSAQNAPAPIEGLLPGSPEEALTAYDTGKFDQALRYYASLQNADKTSASILYNMGNCYYNTGDLARALLCYERALRLAPRDSDVLENLNLTRRKLMLPEKYLLESPAEFFPYVRDSLRMDEWMKALAFSIMVLMIGFGLRYFYPGIVWKPVLLAGGLLFVSAAWSILSQWNTTYSERQAVVTLRNAAVYTLPSEQSGKVEMKLKAGQEVTIEEQRMEWVRIRTGNEEGWMKAKDIGVIWQQ